MTCGREIDLGAYVLNALEPEEIEAVHEHLNDCDSCRDEVRSLAFTASLLAILTPRDLEQFPEIRAVHHGRRRRTRHLVAAALVASVLGVLTAFGTVRLLEDHPQTSTQGVVHAVDPATHVEASVAMSAGHAGTRLQLTLTGAYPRGRCALVARSRDGQSDTAATWVADANGSAVVSGMTAIRAADLKELDVVTDSGKLLVRIPVAPHGT